MEFLPAAVQVLVNWIILILTTISTYLGRKEDAEQAEDTAE